MHAVAQVPASTLHRFVVDPTSKTMAESRPLSARPLDFPSVNRRVSGRRHRFVWAACGAVADAAAPPQGIIKVDTTGAEADRVFMPPPHEFCGEPMFAPRLGALPTAAEDDGYIVTLTVDGRAKTSALVVSPLPLSPSRRTRLTFRSRWRTRVPIKMF